MELLRTFINSQIDNDKESADKFVELTTLKKFKKNEFLSKRGEILNSFYILKSGIVRSYYVDESGKTHIRSLFTKMKTTGDIGALITKKPAKLDYDCLTDCEIYIINYDKFKEIAHQNLNFSKFYIAMLTKVILLFESKVYDLSVLNGTERYLKLKEQIPEIENLIPQYHIASFLNITPVQLSRIRKEIYSK